MTDPRPVAHGVALLKVRDDDGTIAYVTLPDCTCPDQTYRHAVGDDGDDHCKHIRLVYQRHIVDNLHPDQETWFLGSLTDRRDHNGDQIVYEITLMRCSVHGLLGTIDDDGEPVTCPHAEVAAQATRWHPLDEGDRPSIIVTALHRYLADSCLPGPGGTYTFTIKELIDGAAKIDAIGCRSRAWYRTQVGRLADAGLLASEGTGRDVRYRVTPALLDLVTKDREISEVA